MPFKVIQGHWFWYQSKARMWLPISRSLWLWYGTYLHISELRWLIG